MSSQQMDWLEKALDTFPEFTNKFEYAPLSPMGFWIELRIALEDAYRSDPINEDLIGRIYRYAAWCFDQPNTNSAETDLGTAVIVCLIEHLPEMPRVAGDLYHWMSLESFNGFESAFRYHLSGEQFSAFRNLFMQQRHKGNSGTHLL
jgi:hypothetical protein